MYFSGKARPLETYTLYDLNQHIRQVIDLNFGESIWIQAEVSKANLSRGHCYLELIDKTASEREMEIRAKASAIIWRTTLANWKNRYGLDAGIISEDTEVRICVRVDFHEQYGLKLIVVDIDPAFTLGKLALQRQEVIRKLQEMQLLDRNRRIPLPMVIQRIAVISSPTAAGLKDFLSHLRENAWHYRFGVDLYPAAMQGSNTGPEISRQLQAIALHQDRYHAIAILRGGGARTDLLAFDQLELCEAVAQSPLPVLTGIGHDIDEPVIERVAHTAQKTPTAVADFILVHNAQFEGTINRIGEQLSRMGRVRLENERLALERNSRQLTTIGQSLVSRHRQLLDEQTRRLRQSVKWQTNALSQQLAALEKQRVLIDPESVLKRGFSLTTWNDKPIHPHSMPPHGAVIRTALHHGEIESRVENTTRYETE